MCIINKDFYAENQMKKNKIRQQTNMIRFYIPKS